MNITLKKILLAAVVPVTLLFANASVCQANAGPPPTILIIVPNAPRDLEIIIEPQTIKAQRTNTLVESYFAFYALNLKSGNYTAKVTTGGKSSEITFGLDIAPHSYYTNIFTLDLAGQTLTPGKPSLLRSVSILSLQVILTLIIEGIVFYAFGYRKKRSWILFLIFNLITQGILYALLAQIYPFPPYHGYFILFLIFGEIPVFIVELVGFLGFLNEHSHLRTAGYVLSANLISLIAGGYIIAALPVYF